MHGLSGKMRIQSLTFEARYRIVPASSSSLPILCCGTSSRGITPPVDSYALETAVVMSLGNPSNGVSMSALSVLLQVLLTTGCNDICTDVEWD